MQPIRISCKDDEWKRILKQNLAEGREVDLVSFLGDYDESFCRELAQKHSMIFKWTGGRDHAYFKKVSLL